MEKENWEREWINEITPWLLNIGVTVSEVGTVFQFSTVASTMDVGDKVKYLHRFRKYWSRRWSKSTPLKTFLNDHKNWRLFGLVLAPFNLWASIVSDLFNFIDHTSIIQRMDVPRGVEIVNAYYLRQYYWSDVLINHLSFSGDHKDEKIEKIKKINQEKGQWISIINCPTLLMEDGLSNFNDLVIKEIMIDATFLILERCYYLDSLLFLSSLKDCKNKLTTMSITSPYYAMLRFNNTKTYYEICQQKYLLKNMKFREKYGLYDITISGDDFLSPELLLSSTSTSSTQIKDKASMSEFTKVLLSTMMDVYLFLTSTRTEDINKTNTSDHPLSKCLEGNNHFQELKLVKQILTSFLNKDVANIIDLFSRHPLSN